MSGNIQKVLLEGVKFNQADNYGTSSKRVDIRTCYAIYDLVIRKTKGSAILFIGKT